ncbi:helix-turn-helix domain-containing protein [Liquorilactobacillus ghanensis]|uniref:helix-turn-helix domain-containing protein n=1 Tax=Liquorilactobacillus ghanensis TaxID=399370 RepID=UPI0039E85E5E
MADQRLLYFFSAKQPRRPAVIRQILINKRTVSNLFWGLNYQLLSWLAVAPKLEAAYFDQQIELLLQTKALQQTTAGLVLTAAGSQHWQLYQTSDLHYWRQAPQLVQHYQVGAWQAMLALLIQVFSEMSYHNVHYYVNVTDPQLQYWLKRWLQHNSRQQLQAQFVRTLTEFLTTQESPAANIFLNMYSGHQIAGRTLLQLQQQTGWTVAELNCLRTDLSLQLAEKLLREGPAWQALIGLFRKNSLLSASTAITYQAFLNQYPLAKIAQKRQLKLSTIQEHLLEAAIFATDFPYLKILPTKIQQQLITLFRGQTIPAEWNYQVAQQQEISFFYFRLFQIQQLKLRQGRLSIANHN